MLPNKMKATRRPNVNVSSLNTYGAGVPWKRPHDVWSSDEEAQAEQTTSKVLRLHSVPATLYVASDYQKKISYKTIIAVSTKYSFYSVNSVIWLTMHLSTKKKV